MTDTVASFHSELAAARHFVPDGSTDRPLVAVIDNYDKPNTAATQGWIGPADPGSTECHGSSLRELYSAFGLDSTIFLSDHDHGQFFPADEPRWLPNVTYCFRQHRISKLKRVGSNFHSSALSRELFTWAGDCGNLTGTRVVIVQRDGTRLIRNIDALVAEANRTAGVDSVTVVDLNRLHFRDQILTMMCGHPIVAGAHGAGLEWTVHLKSLGRRAAVIEWSWTNWPQSWAPLFSRRAKGATVFSKRTVVPEAACSPERMGLNQTFTCCNNDCGGTTTNGDHMGAKNFDFDVPLESWRTDLGDATRFIHLK
jgi:hypothetical protein